MTYDLYLLFIVILSLGPNSESKACMVYVCVYVCVYVRVCACAY